MSIVLLAMDDSSTAQAAKNYIPRLYHPSRDNIVVVSVAYVPGIIAGETENESTDESRDPDDVDETLRKRATSIGEETASDLREEGFEVDVSVPEGRPGPKICEVAEQVDADVILMGRRGQGSGDEPYIGSVSLYVVHNANCPVNVVPPDAELAEGG